MAGYQIMGRPIAGSFFAECLLREAGQDYEFIWISNTHSKSAEFATVNPLARVPVLVCPDGHQIIEILSSHFPDFVVTLAFDLLPGHLAFGLERGGLDVLHQLAGTSVATMQPDGVSKGSIHQPRADLHPFQGHL